MRNEPSGLTENLRGFQTCLFLSFSGRRITHQAFLSSLSPDGLLFPSGAATQRTLKNSRRWLVASWRRLADVQPPLATSPPRRRRPCDRSGLWGVEGADGLGSPSNAINLPLKSVLAFSHIQKQVAGAIGVGLGLLKFVDLLLKRRLLLIVGLPDALHLLPRNL